MWVPANLYLFFAIGVLFFLWARENRLAVSGQRSAVSGKR